MITCFFVVLQECRVNCIGQVHWSLSEVRQKTAITLSTSRTYQQEFQVFHMDVISESFHILNVIYPFLGVFLSSVMWNVLFACDVHEDIYTECWYNLYNVEFCFTCWLRYCCKYELNNKSLLKTMCLLYAGKDVKGELWDLYTWRYFHILLCPNFYEGQKRSKSVQYWVRML